MKKKKKTVPKAKPLPTKTSVLHVAQYSTWQPRTRTTRVIRRRRVRFEKPAQFIRACQSVVPEWTPQGLWIIGNKGRRPSMRLDFGVDADGLQSYVHVTVSWREALMLDAYVRATFGSRTIWTVAYFPDKANDDDGGGGDTLTVPSMADSLAEMGTLGGVQ
jgi:hypothetical protein